MKYILLLLFLSCSSISTSFVPIKSGLDPKDVQLYLDTKEYILDQTGTVVEHDSILQGFSDSRIYYLVTNDIRDSLHKNVLGDMQKYTDAGLFVDMVELANYGIMDDLNAFKNSENHNNALTKGCWTKISVSSFADWCIIILAR